MTRNINLEKARASQHAERLFAWFKKEKLSLAEASYAMAMATAALIEVGAKGDEKAEEQGLKLYAELLAEIAEEMRIKKAMNQHKQARKGT